MPLPLLRRLRRQAPLLIGLLLVGAAAGSLSYHISEERGLDDLSLTGRHRLDLYGASLEREIDKYAYFPATLGLERDVMDLLRGQIYPLRVNQYLEQLNQRAGTLSVYLLNRDGHVVASSNWTAPDSYVGEDLSYRDYFRQALMGRSGRMFAIGTTKGEPGYYLSSPLMENGRIQGVAVVKVSLEQLEKSWASVEAPVLVADGNGVVILSSVPAWKLTTLWPLPDEVRTFFDDSQQYNRHALELLGMTVERVLDADARLVKLPRLAEETNRVFPVSGDFLAQSTLLSGTNWRLTVFSQVRSVTLMARTQAALAAIGADFVLILLVMLLWRRRHMKDRVAAREALQRANQDLRLAHDELERKVAERTGDLSSANLRLQEEVAERTRAERTLRSAQEELVQASKLAVIGQLSAGIAHELNQPLAALRTLSGNTSKFLQRGDLETAGSNLERIGQLVDKMGHLTGQLKAFARKSSGHPKPVPLRGAIDNSLFLLDQRLRKNHVRVRLDLPPEDVSAFCDPNRLEQVLVNLIGNAVDATAEMVSPSIEVLAQVVGGRLFVRVRDNGPGLTEDVRPHLFEAFFTTKDVGVGLGLGLAISAGIVRDFGGELTADNHPGGGAVFTIDIPLAQDNPVLPQIGEPQGGETA